MTDRERLADFMYRSAYQMLVSPSNAPMPWRNIGPKQKKAWLVRADRAAALLREQEREPGAALVEERQPDGSWRPYRAFLLEATAVRHAWGNPDRRVVKLWRAPDRERLVENDDDAGEVGPPTEEAVRKEIAHSLRNRADLRKRASYATVSPYKEDSARIAETMERLADYVEAKELDDVLFGG